MDLGGDVPPEKIPDAVKANPGCGVGLSALLTTTMVNMEKTVQLIKAGNPDATVLVGGAPVTQAFADQIGADGYSSDPQGAVKLLETRAA